MFVNRLLNWSNHWTSKPIILRVPCKSFHFHFNFALSNEEKHWRLLVNSAFNAISKWFLVVKKCPFVVAPQFQHACFLYRKRILYAFVSKVRFTCQHLWAICWFHPFHTRFMNEDNVIIDSKHTLSKHQPILATSLSPDSLKKLLNFVSCWVRRHF